MQLEFDIPIGTIWNTCRRNDPVCPGNLKKLFKVTWTPTGEVFTVCKPCQEAILARSRRSGNCWV